MTRNLSGVALVAAMLMTGVSLSAIVTPAFAQGGYYDDASFDSFHDELSNYGDWIYSDRWGEVWIPDTDDNFSPYNTNGYWAYTNDYGWTWVSGYAWGDIPFHYGRWVNDPDDGWLWIPGYVWSPAWVAWRSNGSYIGWMALPPDDAFLNGGEQDSGDALHIGIDFNDAEGFYGYGRWYGGYDDRRFADNWLFVSPGHMGDRQFHRFAAPRSANTLIIRNTQNITNYTVVNNYVVNRSVNINVVIRAGGHVRPVDAGSVVRNRSLITSFSAGRATQVRVRELNPHGTGTPFSAPKPSDRIVNTLSTRVPPKLAGRPAAARLFTRDTVTAAPLPPKRGGERTLPPGPNGGPDRMPALGHPPRGAVVPPTVPASPGSPDERPGHPHRGEPVAPGDRGGPQGVAPSGGSNDRFAPGAGPNDHQRPLNPNDRVPGGATGAPATGVPADRDRTLAPTDRVLSKPPEGTDNGPREHGPRPTTPAGAPTDRGLGNPPGSTDMGPRDHGPRPNTTTPTEPSDMPPADRHIRHDGDNGVPPAFRPNVAPPATHTDVPRDVTPPVPQADQGPPPGEHRRAPPPDDTQAPVHHDDKGDHTKPPKNDNQGQ